MPEELSRYGYVINSVDQQKNKSQQGKNIQTLKKPPLIETDDSGSSDSTRTLSFSKHADVTFRKLEPNESFAAIPENEDPNPFLLGVKAEEDRNLWDGFYFWFQKKSWTFNFRYWQALMSDFNAAVNLFSDEKFFNEEYISEKTREYNEIVAVIVKHENQKAILNAKMDKEKISSAEDLQKSISLSKEIETLKKRAIFLKSEIDYAKKNPLQAKEDEIKEIAKKFPFKNTSAANVFAAEKVDRRVEAPAKDADAPELFSRWRLSYNLSENPSNNTGFRSVYAQQSFRGLVRISKTIPVIREMILGGNQARKSEIPISCLREIAEKDRPHIIMRGLFWWTDAVSKREKLYQERMKLVQNETAALDYHERALVLEMFERAGRYLSAVNYLDKENESTLGAYVDYINQYIKSTNFEEGQNRIHVFQTKNKSEIEQRGLALFYISLSKPKFEDRQQLTPEDRKDAIWAGKKKYINFDQEDFNQWKEKITIVLKQCDQVDKQGRSVFVKQLRDAISPYLSQDQKVKVFSQEVNGQIFSEFFKVIFSEALKDAAIQNRDALISKLESNKEINNNVDYRGLILPLLNALLAKGIDSAANLNARKDDYHKITRYGMVDLLDEKIKSLKTEIADDRQIMLNHFQRMREDVELIYKKQDLLTTKGIVDAVSERIRQERLGKGTGDEYKTKTILYLQYLNKLVDAEVLTINQKMVEFTKQKNQKVIDALVMQKENLLKLKKSATFFDKLLSQALFSLDEGDFKAYLNQGVDFLSPLKLRKEDLDDIVVRGFNKEINSLSESFQSKKKEEREAARNKAKNIKRFHELVRAHKIDIREVSDLKRDMADDASLKFNTLFTLRSTEKNHTEYKHYLAKMLTGDFIGNPSVDVETQIDNTDTKLASSYLALTTNETNFNALNTHVRFYVTKDTGATGVVGYQGSDMYLSLVIRFLETMNPDKFGNEYEKNGSLKEEGIVLTYGKKRLAYLNRNGFLEFDLGEDLTKTNEKEFSFPEGARASHSLDLAFFQDAISYRVSKDSTWIVVKPVQEGHNVHLEDSFQKQLKSYLEDNQGTHFDTLFVAFKTNKDASQIRKIWYLYETYADSNTLQAFRIEFLKQLLKLDLNSEYLKTFLTFYCKIGVTTQLAELAMNSQGVKQSILHSTFVIDENLKIKLNQVLTDHLPKLEESVPLKNRLLENTNNQKHLVYEGLAPWRAAEYRVERLKQAYGIFTDSMVQASNKRLLLATLLENYHTIASNLLIQSKNNSADLNVKSYPQFVERLDVRNETELLNHDRCDDKASDDIAKAGLRKNWEDFCFNKLKELKDKPELWSPEFAILLGLYTDGNKEIFSEYLTTQLANVLALGNFASAEKFINDLHLIFTEIECEKVKSKKKDKSNAKLVSQEDLKKGRDTIFEDVKKDLQKKLESILAKEKMQAQFKVYLDSPVSSVNASFIFLLKKLLPADSNVAKALLVQFHQKRAKEIFQLVPASAKKDDLRTRGFNSEITNSSNGSMAIRDLEYASCFDGWSLAEKDYVKDEYQFYQDLYLSKDIEKFKTFFGCDPDKADDILKNQIVDFVSHLNPNQAEREEADEKLGWRICLLDWFSVEMKKEKAIKDYYDLRERRRKIVKFNKEFAKQLNDTFKNRTDSKDLMASCAVQAYRDLYKKIKNKSNNISLYNAQLKQINSDDEMSLEDQIRTIQNYESEIIYYMFSLRASITESAITDKVKQMLLKEEEEGFERENKKLVSNFLLELEKANLSEMELPKDLRWEFEQSKVGEEKTKNNFDEFKKKHLVELKKQPEKLFLTWYARCLIMSKYMTWSSILGLSKADKQEEFYKQFDLCLQEAIADSMSHEGALLIDRNKHFYQFRSQHVSSLNAEFKSQKTATNFYSFVYQKVGNEILSSLNGQTSIIDGRVASRMQIMTAPTKKDYEQEAKRALQNEQDDQIQKSEKFILTALVEKVEGEDKPLQWQSRDKQILAEMLLRSDWVEKDSGFKKGEKTALLRLVLEHPEIFYYLKDHQNDSLALARLFNAIYFDVNRYLEASCSKLKDAFDLEVQEIDGWAQLAHDLEARKEVGIYSEVQMTNIINKAKSSFSKLIGRFFSFEDQKADLSLISEEDLQELKALQQLLAVLDPQFIQNYENELKQKCKQAFDSLSSWIDVMKLNSYQLKDSLHLIQLQNQIQCLTLFGDANQKQELVNALPLEYFQSDSNIYKLPHRPCGQRLLLIESLIQSFDDEEKKKLFKPIVHQYKENDLALTKLSQGAFVEKSDHSFEFGAAIVLIHNQCRQDQYEKLKALQVEFKQKAKELVEKFELPKETLVEEQQTQDDKNKMRSACKKSMNDFLSVISGAPVPKKYNDKVVYYYKGESWLKTREQMNQGDLKSVFKNVASLFAHIYQYLNIAMTKKNTSDLNYFDKWFSDVLENLNEACKKGKNLSCTMRVALMVIDYLINGWDRAASDVVSISNLEKYESLSKIAKANDKTWQSFSMEFMKQLHGKSNLALSTTENVENNAAPTTTASPYAGQNSIRDFASSKNLSRASSQSVISPKLAKSDTSSQTSESPNVSSPSQTGVPSLMNASSSASSSISTPSSKGNSSADDKGQGAQTPEAPNTPKSPSNLPPKIVRNGVTFDRRARAGNRGDLISKLGVPSPNQPLSPHAGTSAAVSPPSSTAASPIATGSTGSTRASSASANNANTGNKSSSPISEKISSPDPVKENKVNASSSTSATSPTSSTNYSFANFFGAAPHPLDVKAIPPSESGILFTENKKENEKKNATPSVSTSPSSRNSSPSIAIPLRGTGRGTLYGNGSSSHQYQNDDNSSEFGRNPSQGDSGLPGYQGRTNEKAPSYSPNH